MACSSPGRGTRSSLEDGPSPSRKRYDRRDHGKYGRKTAEASNFVLGEKYKICCSEKQDKNSVQTDSSAKVNLPVITASRDSTCSSASSVRAAIHSFGDMACD